MIQIDTTIFVTCVIAFLSMIGYLGNILTKGVVCLTSLKKDVHSIKENQAQVIKDIEKIENKVFL